MSGAECVGNKYTPGGPLLPCPGAPSPSKTGSISTLPCMFGRGFVALLDGALRTPSCGLASP